jgi:hypothetical protein
MAGAAPAPTRAGSEATDHERSAEPGSGEGPSAGPSRESIKKLDQIIQVRRLRLPHPPPASRITHPRVNADKAGW